MLVCLTLVPFMTSPVSGSGRYGMVIYEMTPVIVAVTFGMRRMVEVVDDDM